MALVNKSTRRGLLVFLFIGGSVGLLYGIIVLYTGSYQRCDHKTFTVRVTEVGTYSTSTQLYEARGVFEYPEAQKGQELFFGLPADKKLRVGDLVDQCLNLNVKR